MAARPLQAKPKSEGVKADSEDNETTEQQPILEYAFESMASLHRPQSVAERDAERAAGHEIALLTDDSGAPKGMSPGRLIPGSFRLLASQPDGSGAPVYAFRTDRDRVCGGILGEVGGCIEGFTEEQGVSWTFGHRDGVTILFGYAPDRVASVRVVTDAGAGPEVAVHDNAFYVEIGGPTELEAIEVFPPLDGDAERIDLHATS